LQHITQHRYAETAKPAFVFVPASTPRLVVWVIKLLLADRRWPRLGVYGVKYVGFAAAAILGLSWAIFIATIG
jgi:hypothetical protein